MATGILTIDLSAIVANWQALDSVSTAETAAVVKADGYGLGAARVARALARAGARKFFVAVAEEGAALREALGPGPEINIFSGHMSGDTDMIHDMTLTPMINSVDQLLRHVEALPGHPFGIQLDTGMNRLGMEPAEWSTLRDIAVAQNPTLLMSHLACADDPGHAMNAQQLQTFCELTDGLNIPRSLAATGGILLGSAYHFDLTRPGVGLYGGLPFDQATPAARLELPVIQIRDVAPGETVGYSNTWQAQEPATIATVSAGYADGLIRAMSDKARLYHGSIPCPAVGRVSMDLIGVDISHLPETPRSLDILCDHQTVDHLAEAAGTIGYEILTSLGDRYMRRYASA
ncbi:MAG: alanine racemase [Rhodobacterales bacterium]|nr:MAG: alanine racemase [Rhodobacterales bacterium]